MALTLSGGSGELEAARSAVSMARNCEATSAANLKDSEEQLLAAQQRVKNARAQCQCAKQQREKAEEYLKGIESKWEVIDVDIGDSDDEQEEKNRASKRARRAARSQTARAAREISDASENDRESESPQDSRMNDSDHEKLLLVYPFKVDETVLAEASRGLTELGGETLGVHETNNDPDQSHDILVPPAEDEGNNIVIREKDRKLLAGEVLNDTLVDFWMRWISRGENPQISSVHFFPAQFYRVLQGGGPEVVASWTASIDIFKKKFVFVPINKDMHWSLCVIVNPGEIASVYDEDVPSECEHPCLLFLDSLKMHNKDRIRKMLLKWLNFEWMAKKKGEEDDGRVLPRDPFQNNSMNLIVPKVPYQERCCDGGVFVCRYAYSVYVMRFTVFSWDHIENRLKKMITKGPAFHFDMDDIARIRIEMKTLITRLEKKYCTTWLRKEDGE